MADREPPRGATPNGPRSAPRHAPGGAFDRREDRRRAWLAAIELACALGLSLQACSGNFASDPGVDDSLPTEVTDVPPPEADPAVVPSPTEPEPNIMEEPEEDQLPGATQEDAGAAEGGSAASGEGQGAVPEATSAAGVAGEATDTATSTGSAGNAEPGDADPVATPSPSASPAAIALADGKIVAKKSDGKGKHETVEARCPEGYVARGIEVQGEQRVFRKTLTWAKLECVNARGESLEVQVGFQTRNGRKERSACDSHLTGLGVVFDRYLKDVQLECEGEKSGDGLLGRRDASDSEGSLSCGPDLAMAGIRVGYRFEKFLEDEAAFTSLEIFCGPKNAE